MPYVCLARTDIADGVLQVKDLWPNLSQRSDLEPPGQGPIYVNAPDNDAVALTADGDARTTTREYSGIQAYLIDRVEAADGAALTAAQAAAVATALIARMRAGSTLTLTAVNAALNAQDAGTTLTGGDSTGVLTELLSVMAGAKYTVPAGSSIQDGSGDFVATQSGSFPTGTYREVLPTDSLVISFQQGDLYRYRSSAFSFKGTAGAAVTVYADDGTLYI